MRRRNQILNKGRAFPRGENNNGGGGCCMLKRSAGSWNVAEFTGVRERDKRAFYELNNDISTIKRGALLPPRGERSSGKSPLLISSSPVKLVSPSCCLVGGTGAHGGLGAAAGCCRRSRSWAPASFLGRAGMLCKVPLCELASFWSVLICFVFASIFESFVVKFCCRHQVSEKNIMPKKKSPLLVESRGHLFSTETHSDAV